MISLNDVLLAMSNIPVDDPITEIWGRGLQGGYEIIEYTGTLPITISANGDALLDYRIYGASGGVGVVTENLFDKNTITPNSFLRSDGTIVSAPLFSISDFIPVENGDYFINKARSGYSGPYHCVYDENKNFVRSVQANAIINTVITIDDGEKFIRISVNSSNDDLNRLNVCMVVKGTTAPTKYEPYGYKLPMTSRGENSLIETPVYIGDTPLDAIGEWSDYVDYASGKIVRKIAEYTFTGDESFNKYGNSDVFYTSKTIDPVGITTVNTITMRCNHPAFTAIENKDTRYWLNPEADDICCFLPGGRSQVFLRSTSNFTTAAECEAYLKAQFDNGTPVKISYWLKTPVEEDPPVPLPEIPTIDGTTVIDYDGDPKPSQMYVKYKGKG